MKVVVYHEGYGCETGCCGHVVKLEDGRNEFCFDHGKDGEEPIALAKRLVAETFGEEHCKDLDWGNCRISTGDCL